VSTATVPNRIQGRLDRARIAGPQDPKPLRRRSKAYRGTAKRQAIREQVAVRDRNGR
jgi:hypothetical protein